MTHVLDTHYVPAVADSRRLALARIEAIAGRLRTKAQANRFLLSLFALRVGPLRSIPDWLQTSAEGCKDGYPAIAADLFETAKLERNQQMLLLEDLVRVRAERD